MTDITERLRLRTDPTQMLMAYPARPAPDMLCYEAAAEIEQLRAEIAALQAECEGVDAIGELVDEIERLRAAAEMALETLIGCCVSAGGVDDRKTILEAQDMLRAALGEASDDAST